jgi:hypothetical protein
LALDNLGLLELLLGKLRSSGANCSALEQTSEQYLS